MPHWLCYPLCDVACLKHLSYTPTATVMFGHTNTSYTSNKNNYISASKPLVWLQFTSLSRMDETYFVQTQAVTKLNTTHKNSCTSHVLLSKGRQPTPDHYFLTQCLRVKVICDSHYSHRNVCILSADPRLISFKMLELNDVRDSNLFRCLHLEFYTSLTNINKALAAHLHVNTLLCRYKKT